VEGLDPMRKPGGCLQALNSWRALAGHWEPHMEAPACTSAGGVVEQGQTGGPQVVCCMFLFLKCWR
jgi:hypothetical protein